MSGIAGAEHTGQEQSAQSEVAGMSVLDKVRWTIFFFFSVLDALSVQYGENETKRHGTSNAALIGHARFPFGGASDLFEIQKP